VHSTHMQLPAVLVLVLVLRTPFHRKSPPTSSSSWLLVLACLSCFQFGQANTFMVKSGHLEEPHHHPHAFTPHHFALQYIIHTFSGSSHPCTHTFCPTRVYFCWNKFYLNFRCRWLCFFSLFFVFCAPFWYYFFLCNVWNSIIQQIYMSSMELGAWAARRFYLRRKTQPTHSYHTIYVRYKNAMKSVRHSSGNGLICV